MILSNLKIQNIITLSNKVNNISELMSSVCEAITSLKLMVIKSYFDDSYDNYD
jgi:hypothetical protein